MPSLLHAQSAGNALALLLAAGALVAACSSTPAGDGSGVGGRSGTTGGAAPQGGTLASGGAVGSGGITPTGGTQSSTGGSAVSTGGSSTPTGGGAATSGGAGTSGTTTGGATTGGVSTGGVSTGGASKGGSAGMNGGTTGGQAGGASGGAGGKSGAGGSAGATGGTATGGTGGGSSCALGSSFKWTTGAPVILPKSDSTHDLVAVKDPTVVRYNDRWHLFASSVSKAGAYNMVYVSFADWSEAAAAPFYYMDQTPNFNTYTAAPQIFYFTPQKKWYLIFQSGPPMYSTNDDITAPSKWTKPAPFYASEPPIITQNDGWLD